MGDEVIIPANGYQPAERIQVTSDPASLDLAKEELARYRAGGRITEKQEKEMSRNLEFQHTRALKTNLEKTTEQVDKLTGAQNRLVEAETEKDLLSNNNKYKTNEGRIS